MASITSSTITLVDCRPRSLIPSKWEDTVRRLSMTECPEAGRSLALSFATDPLCQYILDGNDMADYSDEEKWKLHVDMMTYIAAMCCHRGTVTAVGSDYDAVALCLPPGEDAENWWTIFRSGVWRLYFQLSPEGRKRYWEEFWPFLEDAKRQVMGDRDQDCYYLWYVGTKPNSRGKGYASKLIKDMTLKADAENRPIYLESSHSENNAYYAKFGFELKKEFEFRRGSVPVKIYSMVRDPQPMKPACTASVTFRISSASGR